MGTLVVFLPCRSMKLLGSTGMGQQMSLALLLFVSILAGGADASGSTPFFPSLQEYEAAWQYWHGAADVTGSTPADIAEAYAFTSCGDIGSIHSSAVGQGSEGFLKAAAFGSEFVNILQQSSTSNVVATDEFGSGRVGWDMVP
eukprot:1142516-Pelagomonas_calceolata.AAC.2